MQYQFSSAREFKVRPWAIFTGVVLGSILSAVGFVHGWRTSDENSQEKEFVADVQETLSLEKPEIEAYWTLRAGHIQPDNLARLTGQKPEQSQALYAAEMHFGMTLNKLIQSGLGAASATDEKQLVKSIEALRPFANVVGTIAKVGESPLVSPQERAIAVVELTGAEPSLGLNAHDYASGQDRKLVEDMLRSAERSLGVREEDRASFRLQVAGDATTTIKARRHEWEVNSQALWTGTGAGGDTSRTLLFAHRLADAAEKAFWNDAVRVERKLDPEAIGPRARPRFDRTSCGRDAGGA